MQNTYHYTHHFSPMIIADKEKNQTSNYKSKTKWKKTKKTAKQNNQSTRHYVFIHMLSVQPDLEIIINYHHIHIQSYCINTKSYIPQIHLFFEMDYPMGWSHIYHQNIKTQKPGEIVHMPNDKH